MEPTICPLKFNSRTVIPKSQELDPIECPCEKEKCMLWVAEVKKCALAVTVLHAQR